MANNITITGDLGSGKSAVSSLLKDRLKFEIVSVGMLQRKLAEKYGLNTIEFNKYTESHPKIDLELDRMVSETGRKNNLIFDSRLAWHFVENSFKVYLSVDDEIAARRIFSDSNRLNESYSGIEQAKINIRKRRESEQARFKAQYNIILDDYSNYDIVIDTSYTDPRTVSDCIISNYQLHAENRRHHKIWLSPKSLIPVQPIQNHSKKTAVPEIEPGKQEGFDADEPVKVVEVDRKYYIYDGHKRVCTALSDNRALLPVEVVAGEEQFLLSGQKANE
ncbi:MAG: cytidylate kinase family protein [Tannerella sp.]|nr:cytidylate kinase family protein [Tannerella sp.]